MSKIIIMEAWYVKKQNKTKQQLMFVVWST